MTLANRKVNRIFFRYVEGRQSSPYQEVIIFRNYFTKNNALYDNNIVLKQVVSNMTLNYLHANLGAHLLEISGFEGVRLPIYQSTSHNGFYKYAAFLQHPIFQTTKNFIRKFYEKLFQKLRSGP